MGGQSAGLIHAAKQIIVSDIDYVGGRAKIPLAQTEGCRNGSRSQRQIAPGGAAVVRSSRHRQKGLKNQFFRLLCGARLGDCTAEARRAQKK
jgi:hypothetical protein